MIVKNDFNNRLLSACWLQLGGTSFNLNIDSSVLAGCRLKFGLSYIYLEVEIAVQLWRLRLSVCIRLCPVCSCATIMRVAS